MSFTLREVRKVLLQRGPDAESLRLPLREGRFHTFFSTIRDFNRTGIRSVCIDTSAELYWTQNGEAALRGNAVIDGVVRIDIFVEVLWKPAHRWHKDMEGPTGYVDGIGIMVVTRTLRVFKN